VFGLCVPVNAWFRDEDKMVTITKTNYVACAVAFIAGILVYKMFTIDGGRIISDINTGKSIQIVFDKYGHKWKIGRLVDRASKSEKVLPLDRALTDQIYAFITRNSQMTDTYFIYRPEKE
jgi:hypothetical protein